MLVSRHDPSADQYDDYFMPVIGEMKSQSLITAAIEAFYAQGCYGILAESKLREIEERLRGRHYETEDSGADSCRSVGTCDHEEI